MTRAAAAIADVGVVGSTARPGAVGALAADLAEVLEMGMEQGIRGAVNQIGDILTTA